MLKTHSLLAMIATMLSTVHVVRGHEFWIMPDRFHAHAEEVVRFTAHHGERFLGDTVARDDQRILRFDLVGGQGASEIIGRSGQTQSFGRIQDSEPTVAVFHASGFTNVLPAPDFHMYLREEGLDEIVGRREALGESDEPGRESYERCSKALLNVTPHVEADRVIGLPLEIVVKSIDRERIVICVLLHGMPADGHRVVAVSQSAPERLVEQITDAEGRAIFTDFIHGTMMITTISMERTVASEEDADASDWTSYWASTTFQNP